MASSHSFVTDVTHDHLTGVGSKRLIAEQQLEVCRRLPCIRGASTEAVVLVLTAGIGRQPFCFSFVRAHVFKSAFIGEAVVMVHEAFDRSPTTSTGSSRRGGTTSGCST